MPNLLRPALALLLLLAAGGLTWWALERPAAPAVPSRLTIAATIFPLADMTQQIAGEDVRVILILPPGTSEHAYTPTPQQLRDVQTAVAVFAIGHELDRWATDPVSRVTNTPIITVDEGISLRPFEGDQEHEEHAEEEADEEHAHEEGSIDPHYWLTVPNAQKIAATIAERLQTLDPDYAATYQQNLQRYTQELAALETELQDITQAAPQKNFIAMHNAWFYLAEHYGFNLVATYEPVEGREPSIADIQRLREVIERYNIRTFFSEPQKKSIGAIRLLENDFELEIREIDPVGGFAPYDSYINLMRANIEALSH